MPLQSNKIVHRLVTNYWFRSPLWYPVTNCDPAVRYYPSKAPVCIQNSSVSLINKSPTQINKTIPRQFPLGPKMRTCSANVVNCTQGSSLLYDTDPDIQQSRETHAVLNCVLPMLFMKLYKLPETNYIYSSYIHFFFNYSLLILRRWYRVHIASIDTYIDMYLKLMLTVIPAMDEFKHVIYRDPLL